jgi:hypothetical protein
MGGHDFLKIGAHCQFILRIPEYFVIGYSQDTLLSDYFNLKVCHHKSILVQCKYLLFQTFTLKLKHLASLHSDSHITLITASPKW